MAWFNASWAHRKELTLDTSVALVGSSKSNFVAYLTMVSTDFDAALTNGNDFIITDDDETTQLDHEIESWDDVSALSIHVKVPSVTSTDKTLYIYYGNAGAADQQDAAGCWSDYHAVYHYEAFGSRGQYDDSIGGFGTGTASNLRDDDVTTPVAALLLGRGREWHNTSSYLDIGTANVTADDSLTIQSMVQHDQFSPTDGRVMNKATGSGEQDHVFMISTLSSGGMKYRFRLKTGTDDGAGTTTLVGTATIAIDVNYWVGAAYNGTNMYLGHNLVSDVSTAKTGNLRNNAWSTLLGGNTTATGLKLNGWMNETRICKLYLDEDWRQTEWNMFSVGSSFTTVGTEENAPAGGSIVVLRRRVEGY